jgi:hypothetical protein
MLLQLHSSDAQIYFIIRGFSFRLAPCINAFQAAREGAVCPLLALLGERAS